MVTARRRTFCSRHRRRRHLAAAAAAATVFNVDVIETRFLGVISRILVLQRRVAC